MTRLILKKFFFTGFILLFSKTLALVVTDPCCHFFEHRGAMFGPELPVPEESIFDYIPERPRIASVEGPLKLTDSSNPFLCQQKNVAMQSYHFENSIALIPRGGCSFAEKVYFAELLGAKAAVVFQAKDSRDTSAGMITPMGNDDVIVMAEDSKFANLVSIPSAFVSHNSWLHILTLLKESNDNPNDSSLEEYYLATEKLEAEDYEGVSGSQRLLKQSDESGKKVFREKDYSETLISADFERETGISKRLLSLFQDSLDKKSIYIVLNETGSLPSVATDALPMMWDSMIFLVKVFLVIWSVMGFAYVSNWIKIRYRRLKRQHVIRSLPCKKYKKLQLHSKSKTLKHETKAKYQKLSQSDDLEQNTSETSHLLDTEAASVTLEEYDPLSVTRQGSDLKLRSPKKKRSGLNSGESSQVGDNSASSSLHSSSEVIDCDNCVICLCEFDLEDHVTVLPCKHIYHKDCIEPWLINKSSLCPICKQSIFKNGESRSINELNANESDGNDSNFEGEDNRRGSLAVTMGMFMIIVLSLTFIMTDEN